MTTVVSRCQFAGKTYPLICQGYSTFYFPTLQINCLTNKYLQQLSKINLEILTVIFVLLVIGIDGCRRRLL